MCRSLVLRDWIIFTENFSFLMMSVRSSRPSWRPVRWRIFYQWLLIHNSNSMVISWVFFFHQNNSIDIVTKRFFTHLTTALFYASKLYTCKYREATTVFDYDLYSIKIKPILGVTYDILRASTHWSRGKKLPFCRRHFKNAFSLITMLKFRFEFHWNLFPRVHLATSRDCFR